MFAERVLDEDKAGGVSRRMSDWTPEMEMLTNIFDRQGEQISVALAAAGARKATRIKPAPRPKTAVDRVTKRRREAEHNQLSGKLLRPSETPQ